MQPMHWPLPFATILITDNLWFSVGLNEASERGRISMMNFAVLGAGGLGKGMSRVVQHRKDFKLVAMADSRGYVFNEDGLDVETIAPLATVAKYPEIGVGSDDAIIELLKAHGDDIDGIFMALPNLPVEFFAQTLTRIMKLTDFEGIMVDALKRTEAVEHLIPLNKQLAENGILYITGCGATPGFLTTAAALAAQSFVEVLSVDINFGVGIQCWDSYKATIREDLIHMDGFDEGIVSAMSDEDIEAELRKRNGLIQLTNMEHADDIILEMASICHRDKVTVGGLVDTFNAQKPVSTTVTVTGKTVDGATGSHQFILSDETTMVDNVCGPALGFLLRGAQLYVKGFKGLMNSAEIMPCYATELPQQNSPVTETIATEKELAAV